MVGEDEFRDTPEVPPHACLFYRVSHLVVDWVWLTRINTVLLSANLCLG